MTIQRDPQQQQQARPISGLAVAALVAGVVAIILLANVAARDAAWAFAIGATAVILAIVESVNAVRSGRSLSWLAIGGGVLGLVVTVLGGIASLF
ncbi:uncharacterized membrane protein HdeD (DUF308 family) [Microbacterium testaceum]|uniref:hypothetical protein n=1 Tax=Microbacterium TaxID=33882 RepID=UPI002786E46F|nr:MULTISPECIES: hypothetical protein [Microbacterium]MDQ1113957.1 uncharacterized membrane protein HdeD (DUF308 family) [Microbacterium testaceum]MDR6098937.1 uncharacterized membrane protein HdeD (DUF308 family) [Microbacterium sp. SORGH_AS_0454]